MPESLSYEAVQSAVEQVSSDHFKTWSRCRRKYYYQYVKRLQWPTDQSHFRLGKSVHKLLEFQSRGLDCTALLSNADPDIQASWAALIAHPVAHLPIVASEWGFHVPIDGVRRAWLTGRVDRIARDGDTFLILDWKTGTGVPKLPEVDWQTVLYLFAVVESAAQLPLAPEAVEALRPEVLRFVYVEVKDGQVREVPVSYDTAQHHLNRERIVETLTEMQQANEYALPAKCPDPFCPYRAICGIEATNPA